MAKVSVIVPTYNEQNYITYLLNDLRSQSLAPDEIIVIDGQSTDKTRERVRRYKEVSLFVCPPNTASQRNYGATQSRSEILIYLDADTRIQKEFLKNIFSEFKKSKADIACPIFLPYKSTILINIFYIFFNIMFILFQKLASSGAGSCLIVKKSVFKKLGGFNTNIIFEDIEFIRRASRRYNFQIILKKLYVSDRRFRKQGPVITFFQYLILSALFLANQFNLTPGFSYKFGNYGRHQKALK